MVKRFDPHGGSRWLNPEAYDALSPAEKKQLWRERQAARGKRARRGLPIAPIIIGSAIVGAVVGIVQPRHPAPTERPARIEPSQVQGVPQRAPDAEDEAWARRGSSDTRLPRAESVGNDGAVRLRFGNCKWGGGTNCVVDGDTFYIGAEKVRIAGIDAPETHDYRCGSELALGSQAAARLQALLNSGAVTMTPIDRDRDVYGRLLRNVTVDGRDVGEALISEGLAREYASGRRPWC